MSVCAYISHDSAFLSLFESNETQTIAHVLGTCASLIEYISHYNVACFCAFIVYLGERCVR